MARPRATATGTTTRGSTAPTRTAWSSTSYCDDGYRGGGGFFIWHSPLYRAGYPIGYRLPAGGSRFAYNDATARRSFGLPMSVRIGTGTIKTNVVGKGGGAHVGSGKSGG